MLIGLTGKSGSGKSFAASLLKKWGALIIDCDKIAHEVLLKPEVTEKIRHHFGSDIFDGNIPNRKKLGEKVFSDAGNLSKLNSIMHPVIVKEILSLEDKGRLCVVDGSELETSGIDERCAHIIVVKADESVRLARITERDKISTEQALLRMKAQRDYSKKAIVIENNTTPLEFEKKLEKVMEDINAFMA